MNTHKRIKNLNVMKAYHDINGNLFIPPKFVVPDDKDWPADSVGFTLGQYANHIRQQFKKSATYYDPADVQMLTDLGFVWDLTKYKSQIILLAAQTYKRLHNSMDMKHKFEVPMNDEDWPEITWGLKLQGTLQNIRNLHIHSSIHDDLKQLGFTIPPKEKSHLPQTTALEGIDASSDDESFRGHSSSVKQLDLAKLRPIDHIDLMTKYKTIYGDLLVPVKFEIPDDEENSWPKSAVGFPLGEYVKKLRVSIKKSRRSYRHDDLQKLADLGFVWDLSEYKTTTLLQALSTYKSLHDHVDVGYNFVVPTEDPWPKATWGMKLGSVLNNVRYNCSFLHIKPELLAMGVDYTVGHHNGGGGGGEGDAGSASERLIPQSSGAIASHSLVTMGGESGIPLASYRELRYNPASGLASSSTAVPSAAATAAAMAEDSDSEGDEELVSAVYAVKNSANAADSTGTKPAKARAPPVDRGFRAKKRKTDE